LVDLSVEVAGLAMPNPLMPGSGPPAANLKKIQALLDAGIGAVVTKTVSVELPDVPKPCMAFDGDLFFNVEKWSEKRHEEWTGEILPALGSRKVPLVQSLGYTPDDLARLIPLFDPLVDGFEISTHYIASSEGLLLETVRMARGLTKRPLFMKLSAHGADIVGRAVACEKGGADGITAINSVGPALSIDISKRAARLGRDEPYVWLSGPAIKPLALRAVYDVSRAVHVPVVACGGVTTGEDLVEFMLAGASAVQCCTGLIRKGPALVRGILDGARAWCEAQGVTRIADIVGTVTPHFVGRDG